MSDGICSKCGSVSKADRTCDHCLFLEGGGRSESSPLAKIYSLLLKASEINEVFWFEGIKLKHVSVGGGGEQLIIV